ncbi:MAG: alpha/beta hydrolase [Anaerolineales bacterium]|nr:alpha/beta hydrolase [Anaerolineales bacterium]
MSTFIPMFTSPEGEFEVMRAYQTIMNKWPVPFKEVIIFTSFGETHITVSGPENAAPVVLLHALLAGSVSWYRNVEALSQVYRVYAVDVVGEGNKSHPVRPITSLDDFLHWFTEVIDGLGIDTLYLAGNSYGGFTAAYYAMKLPERILKVVLIGPAATISPMRPFYTHMFIPKAMYAFFPKLPGLKRVMRNSVNWMHKGLPVDPFWEPFFYSSMVYGGLINQVLPRMYSKEEFAQIKAKVLLILGEQEAIYNNLQSAVRSARELIPNVKVEMIPAAHHVTAVANPEKVNQILLQFFAE